MDALATAHDNHLQMITNRETALVTGVDAWKAALFKQVGSWNYLTASYTLTWMTKLASVSHNLVTVSFLSSWALTDSRARP